MKAYLLVLIGGGVGTLLRYLMTLIMQKYLKLEHWATFWINITGCFLLGLLSAPFLLSNVNLTALFIYGIIGSYTTFSAFEYENINLIAHEQYSEFLKYSLSSCILAIIAVYLGNLISVFVF